MKFAIFLVLSCLCVSFIGADHRETEKIWGDVTKNEMGREYVKVEDSGSKHTYYTFTYPKTPSDRKIVGLKYVDRHPTSKVEFLKGYLGDTQLTIKVTAEGHGLDSTFIFYY